MRSAWFEHVAKTRKKLTRARKEQVSHREAMAVASTTWEVEKKKILKRKAREEKKQKRVKKEQAPVQKNIKVVQKEQE